MVPAALGKPSAGRLAPPALSSSCWRLRIARDRVEAGVSAASSHYLKRDHREILFQSHIPAPTGRTLRFAGPLIGTIAKVFNETIGLISHRLPAHSITE